MIEYIENYIKKNGLENQFQFIYDYNTKDVTFESLYYNRETRSNDIILENNMYKELFINIYENYDDICKIKNQEITKNS